VIFEHVDIFYFFCFRIGFWSTKGGRLIRLMRRGMRTGQTLFPWESNPVFLGYVLGRNYLPLSQNNLVVCWYSMSYNETPLSQLVVFKFKKIQIISDLWACRYSSLRPKHLLLIFKFKKLQIKHHLIGSNQFFFLKRVIKTESCVIFILYRIFFK